MHNENVKKLALHESYRMIHKKFLFLDFRRLTKCSKVSFNEFLRNLFCLLPCYPCDYSYYLHHHTNTTTTTFSQFFQSHSRLCQVCWKWRVKSKATGGRRPLKMTIDEWCEYQQVLWSFKERSRRRSQFEKRVCQNSQGWDCSWLATACHDGSGTLSDDQIVDVFSLAVIMLQEANIHARSCCWMHWTIIQTVSSVCHFNCIYFGILLLNDCIFLLWPSTLCGVG